MASPETTQPLTRHPTEDPPPRYKSVGTSVTEEEKRKVSEALTQAGFENESKGIRAVLLTFVTSAEVRDAVARALRTV